MKKVFFGIAMFLLPVFSYCQVNSPILSGAWETASNWSLGHIPQYSEDVIVPSTYTMTVSSSAGICHNLLINSGGVINVTGADTITIAGDFINAGTFISANSGSVILFNGQSSASVSGSGSYTIAGTIELNMGAPTTSLDILSANFCAALTGSFNLIQGTWIMDNAGTIADCYTNGINQLIIPSNVTIQSNQGAMYLCNNGAQGNIVLEGGLFMNGGNVYVGANQGYNAGIDFRYKVNGGISPVLKVVSGTLYVFAGFNAYSGSDYINFNMSGGTVYIAYSIGTTNGGWSYNITFQLQDVFGGQTVMSGGVIVLQDACDASIEDLDMGGANVAATNYSVTGGTIEIGDVNTQVFASWFAIEPEPTNYPNLVLNPGVTKLVSPWTPGNLSFLSMSLNSNTTFDCTQYNNNVSFESTNGSFALNDQGTFNAGVGTYTFDGAGQQSILGNTTIGFADLVINNSNSSGVVLGTPVNVSGNLSLTNGTVTTDPINMLTIGYGGSFSGGSNNSYINGPVAKTGNSAFVFPTGGNGKFMPIGITAPATSSNTITAMYKRAIPVNPTSVLAPLSNVSSLEYWMMSETASTDAVDVTLYWENGPYSGIYAYDSTLRVAEYLSGYWNDLGQRSITGTFPGAGNIVATTTISNFSNLPITFGTTDFNNNPLPITLTAFTATYIEADNSVLLNWTVETQLNNKEFVIEKTRDGINYEEVATLAGAGTTPFTMYYSTTDPSPYSGLSYYRLKQIDIDGNTTVFPPQSIYIGAGKVTSSIAMYPNPVNSNATLECTSTDASAISIDIVDITGRVINSNVITTIQVGENKLPINTSGLSSGIYFLRITSSEKVSTIKFIKD